MSRSLCLPLQRGCRVRAIPMKPRVFAILVGVLVIAVTAGAQDQNPTPEIILSRMAARYATVRSYQDTGVVLLHWQDKATPDEVLFKTYFVRPDRFRFEWITHHPYPPLRHLKTFHVVWSNDAGSYTYWDKPSIKERNSELNMAVAGATGVSSGSAHTVPRLLTDKITGFALTDLQSLTVIGQEEIEGVPCHHIFGVHPRGWAYELWIGVDDLLLRMLQTQDTPTVTQEIHRDIQIDTEIPETTFSVKPP